MQRTRVFLQDMGAAIDGGKLSVLNDTKAFTALLDQSVREFTRRMMEKRE